MIQKISSVAETSIAALAGAIFLTLACIGVVNTYSPVPFWDMWDGVVFFFSRVSDGDIATFWSQHVNHRTVVSNVLFYLDQALFGGGHEFLYVMNLVMLGGVVALLAWLGRLVMPEKANTKLVIVLAGVVCALCFSWIQKENLSWGFQNPMYAVQIFPLLAAISLFKASLSNNFKDAWFSVALVAAFISPFTMMSGLVIMPLLIGTAICYRLGWIRIGLLVVVTAIAFTLYFIGYSNPEGQSDLAGSVAGRSLDLVQFAFILIGAPAYFAPGLDANFMVPMIVGVVMVVTGIALIARLLWREETRMVGVLFLMLLTYEAVTAVGIAAGRVSHGMDQAVTSRYMTTSLVTWSIYVMLVATSFRVFMSRPLASLLLLAPVVLLVPYQRSAAEVTIEPRLEQLGGALALELGVADHTQIGHIWPFFDSIGILASKARERNTSIFGNKALVDAAQFIGGNPPGAPSIACDGRVFSTTNVATDQRFQRVSGIVSGQSDADLPDGIVISDSSGKAVGYAVTSRSTSGVMLDQAGTVQFIGYVEKRRAPGTLTFVNRHGGCGFSKAVGEAQDGAASIDADFAVPATWENAAGGSAPAGLSNRTYTLAPMEGARSREALPAKAGDKFAVDYSVALAKAPSNGQPAHYVVGPMFVDEKGGVLFWGNVEAPLTEAQRDGRVEATAPEGTVRVYLYVGGMWGATTAPDGEVSYSRSSLSVASRAP